MLFITKYRFVSRIAAYCCLIGFFSAGTTSTVAAPGSGGAGYSHAIQRWIDDAARDTAKAVSAVTVIIEGDPSATVVPQIAAQGGKLRYRWNRLHEVSIPAGKLSSLIHALPETALVRMPYPHQALAVTGQGVALTGAGDMQTLGQNGAGIKIGIIDLGFTGLSTSQSKGELPVNLSIVDYTGTGNNGTDHGTNVAEIVYEMAPGASLYLAKIDTE